MSFSSSSHRVQGKTHLAVFTDLDGTLLDRQYSWAPASEGLKKLRRRGIPVILCTSKTRPETEYYRRQMGIADPFIVENGGAIYIPCGYFGHLPRETKRAGDFHSIESEVSYALLGAALEDIRRQTTPQAVGFSHLSPERLAEITGLSLPEANWAKDRHHDEPFLIPGDEPVPFDAIKRIVEARGLRYLRGTRFHHITGPHDKGTAVRKLIALFRHNRRDFFSIGLGDSPMDIPLLEQVDLPIVVQNNEGTYHPAFDGTPYLRSAGIGPEGWRIAIGRLFEVGQDHIHQLKPMKKETCKP